MTKTFQIRVDFVDTELMDPVRGECLSQFFLVQGDIWQTGLPPLCGINTDQHCELNLKNNLVHISHTDYLQCKFYIYFSLSPFGTLVH